MSEYTYEITKFTIRIRHDKNHKLDEADETIKDVSEWLEELDVVDWVEVAKTKPIKTISQGDY